MFNAKVWSGGEGVGGVWALGQNLGRLWNMFVLKKEHRTGVYVPLRALFLVIPLLKQMFHIGLRSSQNNGFGIPHS